MLLVTYYRLLGTRVLTGYWLLVTGYWVHGYLLVTGYRLLGTRVLTGYWLLVTVYRLLGTRLITGYWLLVTGYWVLGYLLVTGYWLPVTGYSGTYWLAGDISHATLQNCNTSILRRWFVRSNIIFYYLGLVDNVYTLGILSNYLESQTKPL